MKRGYFTLQFLLIAAIAISQPTVKYINDVAQPDPNQASLGKYQDIPVSNYTGTAGIVIPIHTLKQGPLSASVALTYHTGGIRGEEMASRVGLGWTLQAGGSVTRSIQGFRDTDMNKKGYYHYGDELNEPLSTSEITELVDSKRDGEADIFSFNCGGYSGQFYFDADQEIVLVPKQDVKISATISGDDFTSFLILTPDGNRHIFGVDGSRTAQTKTSPNGSVTYISTWHLLRTETYDGVHDVVYDYENDNYSYTSTATSRAYVTACSSPGQYGYASGTDPGSNSAYIFGVSPFYYHTITIEGKRLSSISTATETVSFISTQIREDLTTSIGVSATRSLDTIKIETGSTKTYCKKYVLDQDYFTDSNHETDGNGFTVPAAKRLRLNSVQEYSCNNSLFLPPYSFIYNDSTSVPWRHTKAIDHWGYPNGQVGNDANLVNVPRTQIQSAWHGKSHRHTVFEAMLPGSLQRITYPTGGYREMTYEANRIAGTGQSTSTSFELTNCITPSSSNCCGAPNDSTVYSFSQAQVGSIQIELELSTINPLGLCSSNSSTISLKAYELGSTIPVFSKNWNLTPGTGPQNQTITYSGTQTSMFQDSIPYLFVLDVDNGKGDARIQTVSTGPQDRLVGGLRIKQTKAHDGIDASRDIIKTYDYITASGDPSGTLYFDPEYGRYVNGYSAPSTGGQNTNVQTGIWSSSSFVPMSAFENSHIGYQRVKVNHNGNGHEIYEYHTVVPSSIGSTNYPAIPPQIESRNGKVKLHSIYRQDGVELASEAIERNINPLIDNSFLMHKLSEKLSCGLTGSSGVVFKTTYNIQSEVYRVEKVTSSLDGVETITENAFDAGGNFFAPTTVTETHSDGKKYHTVYTYPHQSSSGIELTLKNLNLLIPLKTAIHVGSSVTAANQIDGTEVVYGTFHSNPYPQEYKRYERTWNASGVLQPGDTVSQAVVNSYDSLVRLPTSITKDGWDAETYTWNSAGLLTQRKFDQFEIDYKYFAGTRLLEKVTNVDETSSSYTYDDLLRLKTTEDCKNLITTLDYFYGSPEGGNYIKTSTNYGTPTNSAIGNIINREYFDGLGRSIQIIKEDQGPTNNDDIVITTSYDNQGRPRVRYEPKAYSNNSGVYRTSMGGTPFMSTFFEPSPLNRPDSSIHSAWTYPKTTNYGANTTTVNGFSPGHLFQQTIIDEDLRQSIIYTDTRGRIVASVQAGANGSNPLFTYTNYDDKDRVVSIIPPGATTSSTNLIFEYTYYGNDLIATKKVPDSDLVEYRYSNKDLPISYQDGYLKNRDPNEWMNTEYDGYGRITKTGFGSAPNNNQASNPSISGQLTQTDYYTTGNHIDKPENQYVRVLNPDGTFGQNLQALSTYDACGRLASISQTTLLNNDIAQGNTHVFTYDNADNVTFDDSRQRQSPTGPYTYIDRTQTIDFAGRPLLIKHRMQYGSTNLGTKTISKNTYNEKDLIDKHYIGHINGSSFLQTCDFTYKENQWLEGMNSALFDFELYYNNTSETAGQPQKNGNIAEIHWQVSGGDEMAFGYKYDSYNRLTDSYSKNVTQGNGSNDYQTKHGYDNRGNMTLLRRRGKYFDASTSEFNQGWIDVLTLTNQSGSNKLKSVTDAALPNLKRFGVKEGSTDFQYDNDSVPGNGNMTYDPTTGATMTYNHLNLPRVVDMGNDQKIEFTYDANGKQLRKVVSQGTDVLEDRYYVGSAEYEDGVLVQVMHDEGRVARENSCDQNQYVDGILDNTFTHYADNLISSAAVVPTGTTTFKADESIILNPDFEVESGKTLEGLIEACNPGPWTYEYALRDHLGSTRIVFDEGGKIIQDVAYYPFGMELTGDWMNTPKQDYNYIYTGKEIHKDFDWDGMNFGARIFSPRLGRWNSIDLLSDKYNDISPYSYVGNMPIIAFDPDGLRIAIVGDEEYQRRVLEGLFNLAFSSNAGLELVQNAISSERTLVIANTISDLANGVTTNDDSYSVFTLNMTNATKDLPEGNGRNANPLVQSLESHLAHELSHFDNGLGFAEGSKIVDNKGYGLFPSDEPYAVEMENRVRADLGLPLRTDYGGVNVFNKRATRSGNIYEYSLIAHSPVYKNSKNSDRAYNYMFHRVDTKITNLNSYLINGGASLREYLKKPPMPTTQLILYEK